MRQATILVAVLAFTPLHSATAQVQQPPVERGVRVRVTTPPPPCPAWYPSCTRDSPRHYVGTFVAWKADTLVVETKGHTLALPWDSVTELEVSQGQKSQMGRGAGIGLLGGGLLGLTISSVVLARNNGCTGQGFVEPTRGGCIALATVGGAVVGTLLGLVVGAMASTDKWKAVPLLRVAPQRDGRFGLGLSVRF